VKEFKIKISNPAKWTKTKYYCKRTSPQYLKVMDSKTHKEVSVDVKEVMGDMND